MHWFLIFKWAHKHNHTQFRGRTIESAIFLSICFCIAYHIIFSFHWLTNAYNRQNCVSCAKWEVWVPHSTIWKMCSPLFHLQLFHSSLFTFKRKRTHTNKEFVSLCYIDASVFHIEGMTNLWRRALQTHIWQFGSVLLV